MDTELRQLERLRREAADDEAGAVRLDHHLHRAGFWSRPTLRLALLDCLRQYLKKCPLDTVVEIDPDVPISMITVVLNGLMYTINTQEHVTFVPLADGRHAILRFPFALDESDTLEVRCYGPLGVKVTNHRIVDPRRPRSVTVVGAPTGEVRRVCNDCDEEVDQHGDCLCSIDLCPPCPSCNGSGYDFGTAHHNVPEPCRDCGGECTIGAYNRNVNERLRD